VAVPVTVTRGSSGWTSMMSSLHRCMSSPCMRVICLVGNLSQGAEIAAEGCCCRARCRVLGHTADREGVAGVHSVLVLLPEQVCRGSGIRTHQAAEGIKVVVKVGRRAWVLAARTRWLLLANAT
jgi:hypothetical protein